MGRPPIFSHAMSGAERVRRHRALYPQPVTKVTKQDDALIEENVALLGRIAALEAEDARLAERAEAAAAASAGREAELEARIRDLEMLVERMAREAAEALVPAGAKPPPAAVVRDQRQRNHTATGAKRGRPKGSKDLKPRTRSCFRKASA